MTRESRTGPTLGRLPSLPVFLKLRERRVVLAGGEDPAVWKAEVLCAAGARLEVFAKTPCVGLVALADELGPERLRLIRRAWQPSDLIGASLALGAIEDDEAAAAFRAAALTARVPVNVVDKPALCDFQFGTIIDRSPLVLAISTDGAAPVFGQAIRARIEALLPEGLRAWAEAAKTWRPDVQARGWGFKQRRRFWEAFASRALRNADQAPSAADRDACLAEVDEASTSRKGRATLVGCGPGALGDVTFGAARALQTADVIVYDADVGLDIINLGRREARKELADAEATERVAMLAEQGTDIVWLGTGDAATCRRWSARASHLARFQVDVIRLMGLRGCPQCGSSCQADDMPADAPSI